MRPFIKSMIMKGVFEAEGINRLERCITWIQNYMKGVPQSEDYELEVWETFKVFWNLNYTTFKGKGLYRSTIKSLEIQYAEWLFGNKETISWTS